VPDSSPAPAAPSGGGIGATLKGKLGPLPTWAWLALITVVLLGYWLITKSQSGASSSAQQGTPADVGQPGVVVINQDAGQPTGQAPPPPPPFTSPPSSPPSEPSSRQITVDKDETLAELAKQRHWSDSTLKLVESMNVIAGQGKLTPKSKLKKGQTILRPLKG
jgi:hypothetical protein